LRIRACTRQAQHPGDEQNQTRLAHLNYCAPGFVFGAG
jgi:hypothetical protein